jgi:hypothetical protein
MNCRKARPSHRLVKAVVLLLAASLSNSAVGVASAAPMSYSFATEAGPFGGSAGPVGLFAGSAFASGTFTYDAQVSPTGTAGNGATRYSGSLHGLSGTADGNSFSDVSGYTLVGNDVLTSGQNVDFFQLTFEPPLNTPGGTYNLTGFDVGGYSLVNVRMFWIEGQNGIPDFLDSQALPPVLPTLPGRLAFDFVDASGNAAQSVFFDGLSVSSVPEPSTCSMLLAGLGTLGFVGWSRRSMTGLA